MICWIDAGAGASGDMLLGALLALDPQGLPVAQAAVDGVLSRLGAEPVQLAMEPAQRRGMAAARAIVRTTDTTTGRTWAQIEPALSGLASRAFARLAEAEAAVHGIPVAQVHFHEVGALDAIADVVGVCALWERLAPEHTVVSPVAVGSGPVRTEHGTLTAPVPAVVELLRGVPTLAGSAAHEACTPTGAALLRTFADDWGSQPAMAVQAVGTGAGGRDLPDVPNVVRILTGEAAPAGGGMLQVEATIDDLDPRIYPEVVAAIKQAGAVEAWLVPVVMKHGRPGVTVTALTPAAALETVTRSVFVHTTTLGTRWFPVQRRVLQRDVVEVEVQGHPVAVKRGWLDGRVVTLQPEYQDARHAAEALGAPVRDVLAEARKKGSDATDGGDSDVRTRET
jgi:uncharacterized protein (TIGR00299 family) protein